MKQKPAPSRASSPGKLGRLSSFKRLAPLLGRRRWTVVGIVAGSAAAGLAEATLLAVVAHIAAAMTTGNNRPTVGFGPIALQARIPVLLIVAGILAVVRLALQLAVAALPPRVSGEVQSQLRSRLFGSYLYASWPVKAKEREGHLQELMGGQTQQAGLAVLQLGNGLSAALSFLMLAASAFLISAGVAATIMGMAAVLFAGLRPMSRLVRRRSAATSAASLAQASGVAESVRMAEEVDVFGAWEAERSRINSLVETVKENFVRTKTLSAIVPVLYQGAVISLLIVGLWVVYALGTGRLAALGAVVLLLVRASSYGQTLQGAYQGLGESLPYLLRVTNAIEHYRASERRPGHRPIDSIRAAEFESVSYSYQPQRPVLLDIDFSIRVGEAVGVVGPSGAGKSTLVQILVRLREPLNGSYRVNSVPAAEIEDAAWHRKIAYLPQEPHLIRGTVAENIRFHRDWVDDGAIERAARSAHMHAAITSWPDGYETVIGQRADAVSVGQKQRLCLARALAGSPAFLILDEPTSSLDLESERLIQHALEELRGSLTLFVVAHRLTMLSLCDRVMVIRDGRLEAFASTDLLYESNEFYRRAVDLATADGSP